MPTVVDFIADLGEVNRVLDVSEVARVERSDAILAYPKNLDACLRSSISDGKFGVRSRESMSHAG
jgi:hypothetical protein